MGVLAVNLRRQIIEHGDFVSFVGELERDVRTDKTRAARDQNIFHDVSLINKFYETNSPRGSVPYHPFRTGSYRLTIRAGAPTITQ